MKHSQNDEETVIGDYFNKLGITQGRFLEIGAWSGKTFSNIYRLAELGWKGVCVEPSPFAFPGLIKTYEGNSNITLINAAISPTKWDLVEWYDSGGDAVSTTNIGHKTKWENKCNVKFSTFWICTLPLNELFNKFGLDFDFINIDVESTNLELFNALPFDLLTSTKMICVEHDYNIDSMLSTAGRHGFKSHHVNGENLILIRS